MEMQHVSCCAMRLSCVLGVLCATPAPSSQTPLSAGSLMFSPSVLRTAGGGTAVSGVGKQEKVMDSY